MPVRQTLAPALIVDRGGRLDLAAVRLLGARGIPVHLILPRGRTIASYSRYCTEWHDCPDLQAEEGRSAAAEIAALGQQLSQRYDTKPVMLFTWERAMLLADRHRAEWEREMALDLAPTEGLETAIDKRRFAAVAQAAGLPVPRTLTIEPGDDPVGALALPLPVFIKPPSAVAWGDLPARLGITEKGTRLDQPRALLDLVRAFQAEDRPLLVQECVEGPDTGHASVHMYRNPATGSVDAICVVRRARVYPAGAGLACFAVSECIEELIAPSVRALDAIGLTGTVSVQWKRDTQRGWRILEIGPRVALSMALGDPAGVNIPFQAYAGLSRRDVPSPTQREGVAWLDLAHDLDSMKTYRRTGEWSWWSWLWSLRQVRSFAFFDATDLRPWAHQLRYRSAY